jgi:threonylcarbamoyladenosine tRNA methylthiotransferase MtaB
MNRRHTVKSYIGLIEQAAAQIPRLGLGTDLMTGFPGETEAAFRNTLAVATDLPFSYLHVFPYSPRPGTAALRLKQATAPATVRQRVEILQNLGHTKRLAFHQQSIGATLSVLFEAGTENGFCHGTTANFTKVAVMAGTDLQNQIIPITITAATERWALGHAAPEKPKTLSVIQP